MWHHQCSQCWRLDPCYPIQVSTQNKPECYRAYIKNKPKPTLKTHLKLKDFLLPFWTLGGGPCTQYFTKYHWQSHLKLTLLWGTVWLFFIASRVERVYDNKSSWKMKATACLLSCCHPAEIFLLTEPWRVLTAFAESKKEISKIKCTLQHIVRTILPFMISG